MECEFEEKQYEQLLNIEMAWRGNVYPAGQVLEHIIGIDAAVFTKDPRFWRLWDLRRWWWPFGPVWKKGVTLSPEYWEHAQRELDSANFPKFKCNVFIQYKRPEFITSPRGKEYGYWRQRYFRYDTRSQQQKILYELEQRISKNSLVVYSCPAFYKLGELWHFRETENLVENSNFVQPHRLQYHQRYTFINGGNDGAAFSEPTYIEGIEFLTEISKMFEIGVRFDTNSAFINMLASAIAEVVGISNEEIGEIYSSILKSYGFREHRLANNLARIFAFSLLTNSNWSIGL